MDTQAEDEVVFQHIADVAGPVVQTYQELADVARLASGATERPWGDSGVHAIGSPVLLEVKTFFDPLV